MDGMIDMDKARELVADRSLWPRVRDFLWDFAPQIHASWREELAIPANLDTPRIRRYVLDSLGVTPCFHDFPKADGSRLLLLDASTLELIAQWLGALAGADSLRLVTDGATVRELKKSLPGVYPEVFGYTAYFKLPPRPGKTGDEVAAAGYAMLFSALAGLPEPLQARLRLKLPRRICDSNGKQGDGPTPLATVQKLLKLKFPEAYALCCC